MKDKYEGQERWMVVVNLAGVSKPIKLVRCQSYFTNRRYWGSPDGEHEYSAKKREMGYRNYLFNDRQSANVFYRGTQAVFAALKDFME